MKRYRIFTEWRVRHARNVIHLDDTGVVVDAPDPERARVIAVRGGVASGLGALSRYLGLLAREVAP